MKLSDITSDLIEDFKEKRLSEGVRTATINRDLALLHRMMKLAERKLLINESPFRDVDFLEDASSVVARTFSPLKKRIGC